MNPLQSKSIRMLLMVAFGSFTLTSCNTSAEKVANAVDQVAAANKELVKANAEYLADMETYRKETAATIAKNNESIAAFNTRIESEKAEVRADYKKKIVALEQKNTDMKKRLDDYKADGKDKWQSFKQEFNRDLAELGKAFKDLTVSNVK
jgi:DNA anti-recombination protein RmuC